MLLNESGLENFNKWLAALRSDQYEQANGNLVEFKDEEKHSRLTKSKMKETCNFCCLGVAVYEICQKEIGYRTSDDGILLYFDKTERHCDFLPDIAIQKLGIPDNMLASQNYGKDVWVYVTESYTEANDLWFDDLDFKYSDIRHKGEKVVKVKVSTLNDDHSLNFKQIADLLEFTYL